jgi:hypothetical protein
MSERPKSLLYPDAEEIEQRIADNERQFLIYFLFEMTLVGRRFPREGDELTQVNAINHRVLNRILDLGSERQWSYFEYVPDMVMVDAARAPRLEKPVRTALWRAYQRLLDPKSVPR